MATYHPVTGAPFQYRKKSDSFAANYYLKFYEAGTDIPLAVAMNRTGLDGNGQALTYDKIKLDTAGYPINPSGGTGIPHASKPYKIVLYKNASDANANNVNQSDWVVDQIYAGLLGLDAQDATVYADEIVYVADPTAIDRNVELKLQEWISIKDFGAVGDGLTDDSVAIATALQTSNNIVFNSGVYLCNGIIIQDLYQSIWFQSNVTLKASANDVVLFRQITSYSTHVGSFRVDSNGKTNITGMRVGPSDPLSTSNLTNQVGNVLPAITGDSGTDELVTVQCGPDVSGTDSECKDNVFPKITANGSRRCLWFRKAPNSTATVPRNNVFHSVIAGTGTNTGVHVEAGIGNTFLNVHLRNITSGATPSATPTGLIIANKCATTNITNVNNSILGGRCDLNTFNFNIGNDKNYWHIEFLAPFNSGALEYITPKSSNVLNVYAGAVSSGGSSISAPPSWSASKIGDGLYRITHNLGTTNYSIGNITPISTDNADIVGIPDKSSNSFTVKFRVHNSSDFINTAFDFTVFKFV